MLGHLEPLYPEWYTWADVCLIVSFLTYLLAGQLHFARWNSRNLPVYVLLIRWSELLCCVSNIMWDFLRLTGKEDWWFNTYKHFFLDRLACPDEYFWSVEASLLAASVKIRWAYSLLCSRYHCYSAGRFERRPADTHIPHMPGQKSTSRDETDLWRYYNRTSVQRRSTGSLNSPLVLRWWFCW